MEVPQEDFFISYKILVNDTELLDGKNVEDYVIGLWF